MAVDSAYKFLVRKNDLLIQLFDPPFDKSDLNPGYIKGYVPGVRENGGQYTHAAIWLIMAFAELQDRQKTWELFQILNPINHASTRDRIAKYKVEPYVIAADVYAVEQHMGRGGWTWYTGSAGWMYQLITDYLLGLKRTGNKLQFRPCIPEEWQSFFIRYRYQETNYHISFVHEDSVNGEIKVMMDDELQSDATIYLVNDREEHKVIVRFGSQTIVDETLKRQAMEKSE